MHYELGGLIHGGAYFRNFTVLIFIHSFNTSTKYTSVCKTVTWLCTLGVYTKETCVYSIKKYHDLKFSYLRERSEIIIKIFKLIIIDKE